MSKLTVHEFLPLTLANGPGARCCLWLQGCTLNCPGCFNPETHGMKDGSLVDVSDVFQWIKSAPGIEGLTVSGGEPLQQCESLVELLHLVRQNTPLSTLIFTGYTLEEVQSMPSFKNLRQLIDVLITGRYVAHAENRTGFIGSASKTVHYFSSRYDSKDLESVPISEVIISPTGHLAITGVEPPRLRNE